MAKKARTKRVVSRFHEGVLQETVTTQVIPDNVRSYDVDEQRSRLGIAALLWSKLMSLDRQHPPTQDDISAMLERVPHDATLKPAFDEVLKNRSTVAKTMHFLWPQRLMPRQGGGTDDEDRAVELLRKCTGGLLTIQASELVALIQYRKGLAVCTKTLVSTDLPYTFRMLGRCNKKERMDKLQYVIMVSDTASTHNRINAFSTLNPTLAKEYKRAWKACVISRKVGEVNTVAAPFGLLAADAVHHLARAVELLQRYDRGSLGAQETTQMINHVLAYLHIVVSISRVNRSGEILELSMDDVAFRLTVPDSSGASSSNSRVREQTMYVPVVTAAFVPELLQNAPHEHHDRMWKGKQRKGQAMHIVHDTLPAEASLLSLPHAIVLAFRVIADVKPEMLDPRENAGMLMFNTFGAPRSKKMQVRQAVQPLMQGGEDRADD